MERARVALWSIVNRIVSAGSSPVRAPARRARCVRAGPARWLWPFASRCQCTERYVRRYAAAFRDRFRDAQGSEPRTERAPVDTQTIKDRRTGSGRPRSPSGAAAQFPSVRRPSPRAMVVLAHDHSHIPFPSCNYTLVHIHTHERTAQAIVSGEGQFAVRTRAHAATPSASQHVSKHPTWQWWFPSSQREEARQPAPRQRR